LPVPPLPVAFDWLFVSSAEAETCRFSVGTGEPQSG
jgi:hypothetical protein